LWRWRGDSTSAPAPPPPHARTHDRYAFSPGGAVADAYLRLRTAADTPERLQDLTSRLLDALRAEEEEEGRKSESHYHPLRVAVVEHDYACRFGTTAAPARNVFSRPCFEWWERRSRSRLGTRMEGSSSTTSHNVETTTSTDLQFRALLLRRLRVVVEESAGTSEGAAGTAGRTSGASRGAEVPKGVDPDVWRELEFDSDSDSEAGELDNQDPDDQVDDVALGLDEQDPHAQRNAAVALLERALRRCEEQQRTVFFTHAATAVEHRNAVAE